MAEQHKGLIHYQSIPAEIKRLGITQQECANMLGCSLSGLTHRIKADRPQIHFAIYGLASYLGEIEDGIRYRAWNLETGNSLNVQSDLGNVS
tara:strand:- start:1490 stop:1765 length:276 start_codon:yes stop_codon:yes gene_type:complete